MIIAEIVSQHAEEAAFLWLLRSNAISQPHYALKDLAKLDDRVEAHLDGLRVAGDAGWELCKAGLAHEENGEVFAAVVMAFESGIEPRIQAVLNVVEQTPALSRGLISALGWIPFQQISSQIQALLASPSAVQKRIGIAACAIHRQDPGPSLAEALASSDSFLKARTLKAVGELGRRDLLRYVIRNMDDEDATCRFWAGWSGALLGQPEAIPVLQRIVESDGAQAEKACAMALRRMAIGDAWAWQKDLGARRETQRMAVQAAGVIGDPAGIPWLLEHMVVPELACVAGESFTSITGVDLAYEDLEGEKPDGFESGPTENPEDENVELDQDEDLPWPDAVLIEQWWDKNRSKFSNGTRYLCGSAMTIESLNEVLRTGRQRQRAAAAIELAMRQPGTPLFEVRAPGFRQ